MVKLIKVAFQKDMIKVNDNGKELWYDCDKAAKGYAKSNFKEAICNKENKVLEEGDQIELDFETRGDKQCVIRVRRPGQAPTQNASQPSPAPQTQSQPSTRPAYGEKSPDVQDLIVKQSTMASASRAVQVLTGQPIVTTANGVADAVITVYRALLAEIKK